MPTEKSTAASVAVLNICARNGGSQVQSWLSLLRFGTSRWSYKRFHTLDLLGPSSRRQRLESRQRSCGIHAQADAAQDTP
jgi:hypothetical protein